MGGDKYSALLVSEAAVTHSFAGDDCSGPRGPTDSVIWDHSSDYVLCLSLSVYLLPHVSYEELLVR